MFDVIQCLIQRCFSYSTPDVRDAYKLIKAALLDQKRDFRKVILILHSQGGIEGGLILDWLLSEVPHDRLGRLEVYTFGNAANHFNNPLRSTFGSQETTTAASSNQIETGDMADQEEHETLEQELKDLSAELAQSLKRESDLEHELEQLKGLKSTDSSVLSTGTEAPMPALEPPVALPPLPGAELVSTIEGDLRNVGSALASLSPLKPLDVPTDLISKLAADHPADPVLSMLERHNLNIKQNEERRQEREQTRQEKKELPLLAKEQQIFGARQSLDKAQQDFSKVNFGKTPGFIDGLAEPRAETSQALSPGVSGKHIEASKHQVALPKPTKLTHAEAGSSTNKVIRYIEHYANSGDFVSRFGVLNFARVENRFVGRIFERPASGHLLNQHYLRHMFPLGPDRRCLDTNEFMDMDVDASEFEKQPESRESLVESLMRGVDRSWPLVAEVDHLEQPMSVLDPYPRALKVKDFSRLWLYRNGGSPSD